MFNIFCWQVLEKYLGPFQTSMIELTIHRECLGGSEIPRWIKEGIRMFDLSKS